VRRRSPLVFLLGAGFSVDAASEAGNPPVKILGQKDYPAHYPLVSELHNRCFGEAGTRFKKSIEELFQESIENKDWQPLQILYDTLMEADYYITPRLRRNGIRENNAYLKFLLDFPTAPLLTFNYDSLPEILLTFEGVWNPLDGYGIPVLAELPPIKKGSLHPECSSRPILHLHGSLCVYTDKFYIENRPDDRYNLVRERAKPLFLFDPEKLGHCFYPFEAALSRTYIPIADRVIAPVRDKAQGLQQDFISGVYRRAEALCHSATQIVAIGYSFGPHDRASYSPLLKSASGRQILLVAPDAGSLVDRLMQDYPSIHWKGETFSFAEWVKNDYPGICE
jgi:hypothetical protein